MIKIIYNIQQEKVYNDGKLIGDVPNNLHDNILCEMIKHGGYQWDFGDTRTIEATPIRGHKRRLLRVIKNLLKENNE